MELNDKEMKFIFKRTRLVKTLPTVCIILLCLLIGFYIWAFLSKPLIYNPFAVLSALKSTTISSSTLNVMAGLFPLFFLICVFLLIVSVVLIFIAIAIEKKYIKIIQRIGGPTNRANLNTHKEETAQQNNTADRQATPASG
jgi:hypothetical protein